MDQPLPRLLARKDLDRMRRYREHLDFYAGSQWPASRGRERRLTFNYAKTVVEKTTSYLMSEVHFTVEPWDSPERDVDARQAEVALVQVYEENNLAQLDFDTELDTAILGDGCYKVTWDPAASRVRVTAPDVQGLYAWWAADDPARLLRVASRYQRDAKQWVTEVWTDTTFELWLDDDQKRRGPNPYGTIPFVIYPNLRSPKQFWGESDLLPLLEPARELNRAMSQLSAILELSGNPSRCWRTWRTPTTSRSSRAPSGRCRSGPGPICWTCSRVAASSCAPATLTSCTAPSTT